MARKDFSDEFKAEAVNLVLEQGYTVTKAAKALGDRGDGASTLAGTSTGEGAAGPR